MPEGQCKNGKRVHTDRRGLAEQGGVSSGVSSFLISCATVHFIAVQACSHEGKLVLKAPCQHDNLRTDAEQAIVAPVPYVRWRRLLPASVLFLLNLGRQRMESSGRASGSLE